jgi:hypothetical protein
MKGTPKQLISYMTTLDDNKIYEVKECKSQRSLRQNKMLWELIHKIAQEQGQDDMEVYCQALEKADAKSDYIITSCEMAEALRKTFRGVRFIRIQEINNKDCYVYKVYLGSSKMNTKEFKQLLDIVLGWCAELGIPTLEDLYYGSFK